MFFALFEEVAAKIQYGLVQRYTTHMFIKKIYTYDVELLISVRYVTCSVKNKRYDTRNIFYLIFIVLFCNIRMWCVLPIPGKSRWPLMDAFWILKTPVSKDEQCLWFFAYRYYTNVCGSFIMQKRVTPHSLRKQLFGPVSGKMTGNCSGIGCHFHL